MRHSIFFAFLRIKNASAKYTTHNHVGVNGASLLNKVSTKLRKQEIENNKMSEYNISKYVCMGIPTGCFDTIGHSDTAYTTNIATAKKIAILVRRDSM